MNPRKEIKCRYLVKLHKAVCYSNTSLVCTWSLHMMGGIALGQVAQPILASRPGAFLQTFVRQATKRLASLVYL